jgi:hypothetical protein
MMGIKRELILSLGLYRPVPRDNVRIHPAFPQRHGPIAHCEVEGVLHLLLTLREVALYDQVMGTAGAS